MQSIPYSSVIYFDYNPLQLNYKNLRSELLLLPRTMYKKAAVIEGLDEASVLKKVSLRKWG
jgi:hypothetical protein